MIRKIMAVIAGYLVFALSAGIWFPLMGYKPHAATPWAFMLETLAYGLFFSLLAGYVTKAIGRSFLLNYILAALIFLCAVLSLLFSGGSYWTQLMTIFLFAPCSLLGSRFKRT
jgi:peptidoglycan/LPS O-acetylase OafA/YrhL